ncbi:Ff.00g027060.m01.CDS01 [Fusarium sp. VM40]|nr:Ff.00g027060.m01.CDS01 [Fusarium sp. VM40]
MDKSKTRPLKSIHLKSRPLTTHALAWSCDAELAVATDDTIYIFLPEYPRTSGPDDGAEDDELQSQYTLSYRASGLIRPDPTLNAQLCSFSGIRVAGPPANDENWFPGVGSGLVTGSGAPICQIVRLEWSPNGLGCNLRPILTALSTSGCIYAVGEHIDRQSAMISGMRTRGFKAWKTLWGLGAQLPLPDPNEEDGYRNMIERIQSFSWAKEVGAGRGLLAYCNDVEEVAIMAVQLFSRPKEDEPSSEETVWDIREVSRFDGRGRHTKEDALDITDPDYVPHGSAFSLKWSPWLNFEGKQIAILAYLAKNHVGFRKVTIVGEWDRGQRPNIEVEKADMTAICMFLSTDSYIEWEDQIVYDDDKPIARGVIATPFDVKPFQVSFLDCDSEPAGAHYTWECSTTYSKEGELVSSNPISGLMIHDQGATTTGPVPYYSIVRLSAMVRNQDWFQTNLPDDEAAVPKWAARIRRHTTRLVPRSVALEGLDSDSDDSEDDFMDEDTTQLQVPESRYRIWGLAHSPGGGTTAVLVSRYSTQHPERRALCKLMFSRRDEERGAEGGTVVPSKRLTTEGQVWEWMYGNGPEVLGTTITSKISPELHNSPLREQFRSIAANQQCVFCDMALHLEEDEAKCENGHLFARCASTGLAIMAPDISRICAVCELRCLKVAELTRVAEEHFGSGTRVESSDEVCGGCAGKFVA